MEELLLNRRKRLNLLNFQKLFNIRSLLNLQKRLHHIQEALSDLNSPWVAAYQETALCQKLQIEHLQIQLQAILRHIQKIGFTLEKGKTLYIAKPSHAILSARLQPRSFFIQRSLDGTYSAILLTNSKDFQHKKTHANLKKEGADSTYKVAYDISRPSGPIKMGKLSTKINIADKDHASLLLKQISKKNQYSHFEGGTPHPPPILYQSKNLKLKITTLLPHAEYENLYLYINNHTPLPLNIKNKLSKDLLTAIKNMHAKKIVHLDLKPENILVFKETDDSPLLKLTDFNATQPIGSKEPQYTTARYASPQQYKRHETPDINNKMSQFLETHGTTIGSMFYIKFNESIDPIYIKAASHTDDMWAIGLILMELYTEFFDQKDIEIIWAILQDQDHPSWQDTPSNIKYLISECLLNPSILIRKKWSAETVLSEFEKSHFGKKLQMTRL